MKAFLREAGKMMVLKRYILWNDLRQSKKRRYTTKKEWTMHCNEHENHENISSKLLNWIVFERKKEAAQKNGSMTNRQ